ncbi:MAG: zf-HC2 domain-containing protein [Micromonosporaceae bacterium]
MNALHDAIRQQLGAYVLGGLSSADRGAVDAHLADCAACRNELSSFAVVPALLGRARGAVAEAAAHEPPPALLPRLLTVVQAEHVTMRRRTRRWRIATAVAAVVAAVALTVAGVVIVTSQDVAPGTPMVAASGSHAAGNAALQERTWGTAVVLELHDMPTDSDCVAWAVSRDGRREQAAVWGPTPSGEARVEGATSILRTDLARVEVTTTSGAPLLVVIL